MKPLSLASARYADARCWREADNNRRVKATMSTRGDGETVSVRRATVADAATISALNADVQAEHAAALPWLFKTPSAETFPPATAAAMLARDDVLVYVAHLGDEPVGYAYAQVRRHPETSLQYLRRWV